MRGEEIDFTGVTSDQMLSEISANYKETFRVKRDMTLKKYYKKIGYPAMADLLDNVTKFLRKL